MCFYNSPISAISLCSARSEGLVKHDLEQATVVVGYWRQSIEMKCLDCEVFGRWSADCVQMVPAMALQRTKGLHVRVRRGLALALQRRWWGVLSIALQKAVANQVQKFASGGADLFVLASEEPTFLADLDVLYAGELVASNIFKDVR